MGPAALWVTADVGGQVERFEAHLNGYSRDMDIALLRICCSFEFEAAALAEEAPTEWTASFHIGFGREHEQGAARVTSGMVVAGPFGEYLGFDAGFVPGDSGSAVYDSKTGDALGILNRGLVDRSKMGPLLAESVSWPDGSAMGVTATVIAEELLNQ